MKIRYSLSTKPGPARFASRWAGSYLALLVVTQLGALPLGAVDAPVTINGHAVHPTRILVQYREANQAAAVAPVLEQVEMSVSRQYSLVPRMVALDESNPTASATDTATVLQSRLLSRMETLRASGQFEFVEPDYIVYATAAPTDAAFVDGRLWGLRNYGQNGGTAGADISATNAWDLTKGSTNVIVTVIDSGIRYTHRDLTKQMWKNPGESGGGKETNGVDDDGNGFVDDVYGINALAGTGNPMDDNDHGSHVAGTIGAAASDGNPAVGVMWNVRLMACKFLGANGSGPISDAITCVNYAVSKGARVLNNSWGGGGYSQAMFNAINAARSQGVLFIAAAGNDGMDNDQVPHYPANYALDNVISVAALDRSDNLADFSDYGATTVHLGAPGVSIYSCTAESDSSYASFDGTSMASPHVSGVAGLIWSHYPSADYTEVRQRLLLGTVPIPALNGQTTTGGRLNAYKALTLVGTGQLVTTVDPPSGSFLLTSSTQPVFVKASDTFGVYNATVTATIPGVTNLTFRNNGTAPDAVANDNIYSAAFRVPAATNSLTMTVVATAPGKDSTTNVVSYLVLPPPPNDYFTNATKVPVGGGVYFANNRFATIERPNEPAHNGKTNAAASLWWNYTPTSNTNLFIDLTGSRINTELAVYTGNSVSNLVPVIATNSDLAQHRPAYLKLDAQAGVGYRIAVAAASSNSLGSVQARFAPGGEFDVTAPSVFVSSPLSGLTVFNRSLTVTGTAVDPAPNASGVTEVLVALNGGIASSANGTTNWTAPAFLTPGLNSIQVRSLDEAGNYSSSVTVFVNYVVLGPTNDFLANALPLTASPAVVSGTTTNATKELGEPAHAGNNGAKSVWWSFQPPADGVLSLSTTNSTFDTLLGVYTGSQVNALTPVASNDDAYAGAPGGFSRLSVALRSNQVYRIAVDGYDGVSGTVFLNHNFTPGPVFHLTVTGAAGGTLQPTSGDYASNSVVTLEASPAAYYTFSSWTGDVVSFANPFVVTIQSNMTVSAVFKPVVFSDGFESGNFSQLAWTTGGNQPWVVTTNSTAAGLWAARSGTLTDNQVSSQISSLILATNCQAGSGSFEYRVSSEATYDYLKFSLDGVELQRWSGEVGWAKYVFPLTAGSHTLRWDYVKDPTLSAGLDAAFLDNVILPFGIPINASTPATLQMVRQGNGSLLVQVLGQTNQQYVIQGATNLTPPVSWQNLSTNVATDGVIQYVDPSTGTNPFRFYRAIVPVP